MQLPLQVIKPSFGPSCRHFLLDLESPVFQGAFKCGPGGWQSNDWTWWERGPSSSTLPVYTHQQDKDLAAEKLAVKPCLIIVQSPWHRNPRALKRNEKGCPCLCEVTKLQGPLRIFANHWNRFWRAKFVFVFTFYYISIWPQPATDAASCSKWFS